MTRPVILAPDGTPARRGVPQARWLRDMPGGVLAARPAGLLESRDEIRRMWDRISALALDFIQNSGELKGAVDQVLADTVGVELKLNPKPDLVSAGYSTDEVKALCALIKLRWRQWAWSPNECDLRGKMTVPSMVDVALRHHIAYGESTAIIDWMARDRRRDYGCRTGVKVCMVSPHRLVRDTDDSQRLYQGILHDALGRPVAYRFLERANLTETKRDYRARDADGRQVVVHVFDPWDASDTRGISVIAAAMRSHANATALGNATVQTAILQTVFAATLTSPEPSEAAFNAIEAMGDVDNGLKRDFLTYFSAQIERAAESSIRLDGAPQVSHLAPGEKLETHGVKTPGPDYLPFANSFKREMARCIGVTYSSYALDHNGATYSSVRMENSSIWPIVLRRRERIAAPIYQAIYENWLDGEIGEGRIPFKGGYAAFRRMRDQVTWAEWQGPAAPTADDFKSAKAATERLLNGTSTLDIECGALGVDKEDILAAKAEDIARARRDGLPNPYLRMQGGAPDPSPEPHIEGSGDASQPV